MSNLPDDLTRDRLLSLEDQMAKLCAEGLILETRGSRPYREKMTALRAEYKKVRSQQDTVDIIHAEDYTSL